MNIKNGELKRVLKFACGKFKDSDELTEEDLERIYELNLNQISVTGKKYDIDLSEIPDLPNLRKLSLKNFVVEDEELDFINKNQKLVDLSFDRCMFDTRTKVLLNQELKSLSMRYCDNIGGIRFLAPDNLKIIGMDRVNVARIKGLENVKYLNLQSSRIYGLESVTRCKDLQELNLDGADYSPRDLEYAEVLKNSQRVKVSMEDEYHPTM